MKKKEHEILFGVVGAVLGILLLIAAIFLIRKYVTSPVQNIYANQLANVKIKVDFVNNRRIALEVFFPLDYHMVVPGAYTLQCKNEDNRWESMALAHWNKELENTSILTEALDDGKYPDIGFASECFEFAERYGKLKAGEYRVVFPVMVTAQEAEYLLAVPFRISGEYEYDKEPTEYEYQVTTRTDTDLVRDYERCKSYISYDDFLSGFENYTFSRDLYEHLTKIRLTKGKETREIQDPAKMHRLYAHFAAATMSRSDQGVFGGSFFRDINWDTRPRALEIPVQAENAERTIAVQFFFQYDGQEKRICCEISGHKMVLKTSDFAFDAEMVESMPLGVLLPAEDGVEREMEYYVFNDLEKALE